MRNKCFLIICTFVICNLCIFCKATTIKQNNNCYVFAMHVGEDNFQLGEIRKGTGKNSIFETWIVFYSGEDALKLYDKEELNYSYIKDCIKKERKKRSNLYYKFKMNVSNDTNDKYAFITEKKKDLVYKNPIYYTFEGKITGEYLEGLLKEVGTDYEFKYKIKAKSIS
jgi:hypothetical protein